MTEGQIERMVEREFDRLDARLMSGKISQAEYDAESKRINARASAAYAGKGAF